MRILDAYLSRKAQAVKPTAIVYRIESGGQVEEYILELGKDDSLSLGKTFGEAKAAVLAWVTAQKARGETR